MQANLGDMIKSEEAETKPTAPLHTIIIDCTTMGYVDSVGVSTLSQVGRLLGLVSIWFYIHFHYVLMISGWSTHCWPRWDSGQFPGACPPLVSLDRLWASFAIKIGASQWSGYNCFGVCKTTFWSKQAFVFNQLILHNYIYSKELCVCTCVFGQRQPILQFWTEYTWATWMFC